VLILIESDRRAELVSLIDALGSCKGSCYKLWQLLCAVIVAGSAGNLARKWRMTPLMGLVDPRVTHSHQFGAVGHRSSPASTDMSYFVTLLNLW
jgi:hypothetical protein